MHLATVTDTDPECRGHPDRMAFDAKLRPWRSTQEPPPLGGGVRITWLELPPSAIHGPCERGGSSDLDVALNVLGGLLDGG